MANAFRVVLFKKKKKTSTISVRTHLGQYFSALHRLGSNASAFTFCFPSDSQVCLYIYIYSAVFKRGNSAKSVNVLEKQQEQEQ